MTSQIARLLGFAFLMACSETTWAQQQSRPEVPKGVEVQARGPVHEAFATPLAEPQPTPAIPRKPPAPIEELAPEERPEGDAIWIGGYWAWDDDRRDFLWVSGCWRVKPAGKEWAAGYWRETAQQWQWVSGFWTTVQDDRPQNVTYFPQPPAPPQIAPPPPQAADEFYVPGYWMWHGDRYAWRAGYSARVRPGYVFIASHYQWTPSGYVFIPGYWDYSIAQRGLLYAPVIVDPVIVGPTFVYTPCYAVTDTLVIDAFFVRPAHRHYYFGDYFHPGYVQLGYEPVVVYSRRCYEPIIVYNQWEYRQSPRWLEVQIAFYGARSAGRAPVPPRTLVQQNTIIQNNVTVNNVVNNTTVNNVTVNKTAVLAPASDVLKSRGQRTVPLDAAARSEVQKSAATQQTVAVGRKNLEQPTGVPLSQPRAAALHVPPTAPARTHGGLAAKSPPPSAAPMNPANPFVPGERPKTGPPVEAPQPRPNSVPPKLPIAEASKPVTPPTGAPPVGPNAAPNKPVNPVAGGEPLKGPVVPKQTATAPQPAPPKVGGAPASGVAPNASPLPFAAVAPPLKSAAPPRPQVGPSSLPPRSAVQPLAAPPAPVRVPPATFPKTAGTPAPAFAPKAAPDFQPVAPPPGGPPRSNVPPARPTIQPQPGRPPAAPPRDPDRKKG